MIEINEVNFSESVQDGVSVVDFSATWCGPCRLLAPVLEELQNANVYKVDIDANNDLTANYRISSVPCLVFFKDGVERDRLVGVVPKSTIQGKIDELLAEGV